jgi:hypothetical protein
MHTVHSSTGTQWPILQSRTEQKFKSGLFNVSAEFIRPVGNTTLPSVIVTSEGDIDVWPEPTVSVGTDGFERINATGYAIWRTFTFRKFSLEVSELDVVVRGWKFVPGEAGEAGHWVPLVTESKVGGYLFETSHSTTMRQKNDDSLPIMPTLRILNTSGVEALNYNLPGSGIGPVAISVSKQMKNIQVTDFGNVEQVEMVHGIISARVEIVYPDPNTPDADAP